MEDFDIAIAARAVALEATLMTSNRKHFARIEDLRIEDWAYVKPVFARVDSMAGCGLTFTPRGRWGPA